MTEAPTKKKRRRRRRRGKGGGAAAAQVTTENPERYADEDEPAVPTPLAECQVVVTLRKRHYDALLQMAKLNGKTPEAQCSQAVTAVIAQAMPVLREHLYGSGGTTKSRPDGSTG